MRWALESSAGVWPWTVAALIAAAFSYHAARSLARRPLILLRGLAVAALILALLRPALLSREGQLTKPRLLILLDTGHSMKGKAPSGGSRLGQAAAWLKKNRAAIESRADVTVVLVSDRARALGGLSKLDAPAAEDTAFKLEYKLPFERFLNPERPSAPDIDMDYADNRRDEIIDYARSKYGADNVAQIGTFGTMMARAASCPPS